MMNPSDCLELVLAFSRTRSSLVAVWNDMQFAKRILVKILKSNNLAKIKLPSHKKME
jgi:hypothetical protein